MQRSDQVTSTLLILTEVRSICHVAWLHLSTNILALIQILKLEQNIWQLFSFWVLWMVYFWHIGYNLVALFVFTLVQILHITQSRFYFGGFDTLGDLRNSFLDWSVLGWHLKMFRHFKCQDISNLSLFHLDLILRPAPIKEIRPEK